MIYQLMNVQFPIENMLIINNGFISVAVGKQYFDFEKIVPRKNGIFIDAGAFNGNTIQEYIEWSGNDFKKIYALEPNQLIYNCYLKERLIAELII